MGRAGFCRQGRLAPRLKSTAGISPLEGGFSPIGRRCRFCRPMQLPKFGDQP